MSFFQLVSNKIKDFICGTSKYQKPKEKYLGIEKDVESSLCSIIEDQERFKCSRNLEKENLIGNKKGLSILPIIYALLNFSVVIILNSFKLFNSIKFQTDNLVFNTKILSFFDMKLVSPIIYHIFTLSNAIIAISIIITLYHYLVDEYRFNEENKSYFWVRTFLFLGLCSQLLQIGLSFESLASKDDNFTLYLKKEFKMDLIQIIFLIYILLFVIFSMILTKEIYKVKIFTLKDARTDKKESLLGIKMVILLYIILMALIYICAYFYKHSDIDLTKSSNNITDIIVAIFPYLLHFFSGIFFLTLYVDLKSCSIGLFSQKSECYIYDESNKNEY